MPQQRIRRIFSFLAVLEEADVCGSREEAFALVHATWLRVNMESTTPDKDIEAFRRMQLRAEDGWQNLEGDPCHLQSIERSGLCLYLHRDGAFVIQDLSSPSNPILMSKLGAKPPMEQPAPETISC